MNCVCDANCEPGKAWGWRAAQRCQGSGQNQLLSASFQVRCCHCFESLGFSAHVTCSFIYLTDRLVIERLVEAHADSLFASFLDERLYQFIPERPPKDLETMRREFRDFEAGAPTGSGELWLNWVVRLKAGGESIGTLQVTRFADGLLWLGYKFAPRVWGNGYASESLRWLVAELAQSCGQQQLLAAVDIRNEASVRVLERTGFNRLRTEAASLHGVATEDYVYVFEL